MVVPPTPLHTSRVLTEDKELWEDVKVKTAQFHNLTTWWQYSNTLPATKHLHLTYRRNWPALWPQCESTMTRWRSRTWTCPTTLCSPKDGRGPCPGPPTQSETVMEGPATVTGHEVFHGWLSSYSSLLYCTQTIKKCHLFWIVVSLLCHL